MADRKDMTPGIREFFEKITQKQPAVELSPEELEGVTGGFMNWIPWGEKTISRDEFTGYLEQFRKENGDDVSNDLLRFAARNCGVAEPAINAMIEEYRRLGSYSGMWASMEAKLG